MQVKKSDIIAELQRDILSLQGFRPPLTAVQTDVGLGAIAGAFPHATFPTGAVHEFLCAEAEEVSATAGFICGLIGGLMKCGGVFLWISPACTIFPPALKSFGIDPHRVIFISTQKETDVVWVMEEALKCEGLAAVVAEMKDINFTASRRLQLAVEQSRVTGFILRRRTTKLNTTACVSRWKVKSVPGELEDDMPGVGFPKWQVELLKVRNGKPGIWTVEWAGGKFRHVSQNIISMVPQQKRNTG